MWAFRAGGAHAQRRPVEGRLAAHRIDVDDGVTVVDAFRIHPRPLGIAGEDAVPAPEDRALADPHLVLEILATIAHDDERVLGPRGLDDAPDHPVRAEEELRIAFVPVRVAGEDGDVVILPLI